MIALLVGSLSCTIAVGDRSTPQTTEERALLIANTFAQAYVDEDAEGFYKYLDPSSENAEGDTFSTGAAVYKRYTTRYEPETPPQTALIVTNTSMTPRAWRRRGCRRTALRRVCRTAKRSGCISPVRAIKC